MNHPGEKKHMRDTENMSC